jgi:hypothetical protein
MAFNELPTYAFTPGGIRQGAPDASGIYAIFTPTRWVLIADADNMRQALFRLLDSPTECMQSQHPLSFSCEDVPRSERQERLGVLIAELRPRCNGSRGESR